jgi:hypothetical protein
MTKCITALFLSLVGSTLFLTPSAFSQSCARIKFNWAHVIQESRTPVSMEVCVEFPLRRAKATYDQLFHALRHVGTDYVRLSPWYPYPRLAVIELEPPHDEKTFWHFSLLDPVVADFMEATSGHSVDMNISTIPEWMFNSDKPVLYPTDPDEIAWNYEQGTQLRDASMKEVADYWARVAGWYTQGV